MPELEVAIQTSADPACKWSEQERAHEGRVAFAVSSPFTVRIGQESCPLDVRWILTSYRDVRWIKPAESIRCASGRRGRLQCTLDLSDLLR